MSGQQERPEWPVPRDHDGARRPMADFGRVHEVGYVLPGWACRLCGRPLIGVHRAGAYRGLVVCATCDTIGAKA